MPRYFIDTIDGVSRRDEEGVLLPDLPAACRRASQVLTDMVRDEREARTAFQLVASVRDERGRCVATASLVMTIDERG